jgi:FKBP-type peptidyl-prolyl cis-trans isomerase
MHGVRGVRGVRSVMTMAGSREAKEQEPGEVPAKAGVTRRAALATALVFVPLAPMALAASADDLVVFDEAGMLEAEATSAAETAAETAAAQAGAQATPQAVTKIAVQTGSSSSIDGQGSLSVLLSDDIELAEDELSVTERQALQINRRTQKQNNVPPDFPLFARDGYDMTVLVSNGYKVTDDGLLYKDYVVGSGPLPSDGQQVTFDYTGYNESGGVIDSSYRKGAPSSMRIGVPGSTVVPGFELGVKTMAVGGKRRIVVPPELGPPVGPQTFFSAKVYEIFDVELRSSKTCVRRTVGMFSDVVCTDD